jgi:nitroimidazol reductase NimA-like FMN-containing flavoprotein (pyridoxamine 5'-phosphate oxidase superfamily)
LEKKINDEEKEKIYKILSRITFCSLSTCSNGQPHTTIVQHSITSDLNCIILAKNRRKKISNIKQNNKVWLTFDATGSFKIPKAIYIKGKAELEPLNQESFEEFLSYHGVITKKIYKKLTAEGLEYSTRILIKPEKIITIGIFGKLDDTVSFTL